MIQADSALTGTRLGLFAWRVDHRQTQPGDWVIFSAWTDLALLRRKNSRPVIHSMVKQAAGILRS